jgi:hypothetical protein
MRFGADGSVSSCSTDTDQPVGQRDVMRFMELSEADHDAPEAQAAIERLGLQRRVNANRPRGNCGMPLYHSDLCGD